MEYNEDDFISHYYPKPSASKPLGTVNGYSKTGITVPSDHPDYQKQYWFNVKKPRLQAERDRQKGLLTIEEALDIVAYAQELVRATEDFMSEMGDDETPITWFGEIRVHNGVRWVYIDSSVPGSGYGQWNAKINGVIHSEEDPFGEFLD